LQQLLDTIVHLVALAQQLYPIAGQLAQFPNLQRGHEASSQQPILQQLSQPFAVFLIGFSARHGAKMLRV